MKVLHLNTKSSGGGAAELAFMINDELNSHEDIESILVYGRGEKKNKTTIPINSKYNIYLNAFLYRIKNTNHAIFDKEKLKELIDLVDIVNIHNIHGYYIDYRWLLEYLIKTDKKIIWTFHDFWSITGRCASNYECDLWLNGCKSCPSKSEYPKTILNSSNKEYIVKSNLIKSIKRENIKLVTPSRWMSDLLKNSFWKDYNIEVVNNGIRDYSSSKCKNTLREKYGIPINKKVILFVAANLKDTTKGINFVLDIFEKLKDKVCFISVGEKINTNMNILQMGYISDKNMLNEIYKLSDIFINPTLRDNFPTTILEAMSNGIPTVAFDTGGINEIVNEKVGILVERANKDELLNAINLLVDDSELYNSLSHNCITEFKERYLIQKCVEKYIKIYKDLQEETLI